MGKNVFSRIGTELKVTKRTPESEALALQGFSSKISYILKEDLQATGSFEVFLSLFCGISLEYKVLRTHTHTHIYRFIILNIFRNSNLFYMQLYI